MSTGTANYSNQRGLSCVNNAPNFHVHPVVFHVYVLDHQGSDKLLRHMRKLDLKVSETKFVIEYGRQNGPESGPHKLGAMERTKIYYLPYDFRCAAIIPRFRKSQEYASVRHVNHTLATWFLCIKKLNWVELEEYTNREQSVNTNIDGYLCERHISQVSFKLVTRCCKKNCLKGKLWLIKGNNNLPITAMLSILVSTRDLGNNLSTRMVWIPNEFAGVSVSWLAVFYFQNSYYRRQALKPCRNSTGPKETTQDKQTKYGWRIW